MKIRFSARVAAGRHADVHALITRFRMLRGLKLGRTSVGRVDHLGVANRKASYPVIQLRTETSPDHWRSALSRLLNRTGTLRKEDKLFGQDI